MSMTPTSSPASTAAAIKRMLRTRLGQQWRVGDRLPPVKELARQMGTGQSSTHQAVRELAAEGLLESRQRRGTYVLRTPVLVGGHITAGGSRHRLAGRTISTYCFAEPEGFIWRMIDGFNDELASTGASVVGRFFPKYDISEGEPPPFPPFDSGDDAVAVFNIGSQLPPVGRPDQLLMIVSTVAYHQLVGAVRYDMVTVDELHGGSLAGRALRASGCRNVCFLGRMQERGSDRCDTTSSLRLCGFESTWGRPVERQNLLLGHGYSPQAGAKLFRHFMRRGERLDGVFAASDDLAVGFVSAAISHGLMPGKDFMIVGFDGQERGQSMEETALTTVKVPSREMGRRAAQLLIERFADPDRPTHRIQLECALHRGATTHFKL